MREEQGIVTGMCAFLTGQGIPARPAWAGEERARPGEGVVVVGLRRYEAAQGGFAHYLGEHYDEDTARWQEVYGKQVEVELSLDLYAGERQGGGGMQELLERLVQELTLSAPEGVQVGEITCGPTRWDGENRCLTREVSARCTLWLRCVAGEGGAFTDFELRGGWKI